MESEFLATSKAPYRCIRKQKGLIESAEGGPCF